MWGMPLVILWVNTEIGNSYNQNTGPVFLLSPLRGLMEELELQHFIKQPAPSPVLQKTLPPNTRAPASPPAEVQTFCSVLQPRCIFID